MGAKFQSTLPARGSDVKYVSGRTKKELISIHAPHEGERHGAGRLENGFYNISIHAPHEGERRLYRLIRRCIGTSISIHAPHEGERL